MNRLFAIAKRHTNPLILLNLFLILSLAGVAYKRPKSWVASAQLIVPPSAGRLDVNLGELGQFRGSDLKVSEQLNPLKMLSSILLSEDSMNHLWQEDPNASQFESVTDYTQLFTVKTEKSTSILALTVEGEDPELTQQRLEKIMGQFWQRLEQLRLQEAQGRRVFSQPQVLDAQARLTQAETALTQFQQASGLIQDAAQTRMQVETLHQLKRRQKELQTAQIASQTQFQLLQARLGLEPKQAVQALTLDADESYQRLQQQITELDIQIAQQRTLYTDQHPRVANLLSERAQLWAQSTARQASIADVDSTTVKAEPQSAPLMQQLILAEATARSQQQEVVALQQQIDQMEQQLSILPKQQAQLKALQRDYEIAEDFYNGLVAQNRASHFNTFSAYPNVQLLDQPNLHGKPLGPKLSFMLLGTLLASGFSSIALILLLEHRNPLLSPADVFAADLPVLGLIPQLPSIKDPCLEHHAPNLAFQRLASSISMMQLSHHSILVSSAAASEGKTTVTLGLGQALVALGFRVLLVDADFYQTGLTRSLQQSLQSHQTGSKTSLSDYRAGEPVAIAPKLDFLRLSIHPEQAMEFVARGHFNASLKQAEAQGSYDYILVDSAPVGLTGETPLIGSSTHNLLFVTRVGFSERDRVYRSLAEFSRHHVQLLGLVINEAGENHAPYRPFSHEQQLVSTVVNSSTSA